MSWTAADFIALLLTVVVSVLLSIIELRISFPGNFASAMRTGWSWLIISINLLISLLMFLVLSLIFRPNMLIGVISPLIAFTLSRTDLSILRNFSHTGGIKGFTIGIGKTWFKVMRPLYDGVSLALSSSREKNLKMLLYRYSSTEELLKEAKRCASEVPSYKRSHIEEMLSFLDQISASDTLTEAAKRVAYARFILHTAGEGHIRRLAERKGVAEKGEGG